MQRWLAVCFVVCSVAASVRHEHVQGRRPRKAEGDQQQGEGAGEAVLEAMEQGMDDGQLQEAAAAAAGGGGFARSGSPQQQPRRQQRAGESFLGMYARQGWVGGGPDGEAAADGDFSAGI